MLHHFADLLDRDGGYWTIVPNAERHTYGIGDVPPGSDEITIATIGKNEPNWQTVLALPNLEELTLHEPTAEQIAAVATLPKLKRLRVTHAKVSSIDFIAHLGSLEELVLEYVSGFGDLRPLEKLTNLRAVHVENLRRVTCFDGLPPSLRYLAIQGTLDWNQPIDNFEFLRPLANLEVLRLWQFINKSPYPALLPATALVGLKRLHIAPSYLPAEEYALLEVALAHVDGSMFGPHKRVAYSYIPLPKDDIRTRLPEDVIRKNHPEVILRYDGGREIADPQNEWFVFTGKSAGRTKCASAKSAAKCESYAAEYDAMKAKARTLLQP